jgi:uncharacterized membrane protein
MLATSEIVKLLFLATVMLILDAIYLGVNSKFLIGQLQAVQKSPVVIRYTGAILCYLLLLAGLYYFVIRNKKNTVYEKVRDAAILGIVIYGVYETTSYATFKAWTPKMLVMDTVWGGILLSLTTYIYYMFFSV